MRELFILPLVCFIFSFPLLSETVKWDWLSAQFAPCEAVGIHGSYRVYVETEVERHGSELRILALSVFASSAAFADNPGDLGATVILEKAGRSIRKIVLVRQGPNSIATEPGPNDTPRKFFSKSDLPLDIPSGTKLVIEVTVITKTPSGSCSLGSSKSVKNLFE